MSNLSTNITALAYFANKSSCTDNGMDVSLTVRFGRTTMTGEVTLLPSADGGWTSWGSPDHWVDGKLLDGVKAECAKRGIELRDALDVIESAAAQSEWMSN
jgi:hypothetical protein